MLILHTVLLILFLNCPSGKGGQLFYLSILDQNRSTLSGTDSLRLTSQTQPKTSQKSSLRYGCFPYKIRYMPCGNLGTSELLIVCIILLLLFGAKRLPALARSVGSGINEFKRGLNTPVSDLEDLDEEPDTPKKGSQPRKKKPPKV